MSNGVSEAKGHEDCQQQLSLLLLLVPHILLDFKVNRLQ